MPLKKGRCYLPDLFAVLAETKAPQKAIRVDILKEYVAKGADHEKTLRGFVECLYHPQVTFDLPEGPPPYKPSQVPDLDSASMSFFSFFQRKYVLYFAENKNKIQNQMKREMLFVQVLESMHPKEAALLIAMKDKDDSKIKFFNESLVREAFPTWLPPEEPKKS